MGDIAAELKTYLKTKSSVTDLVGAGTAARIYRHMAKQSTAAKPINPPYIVFEIFEGTSEEHLDGISGVASNRIQVDAYGTNASEAYTLAEAIRLAPLQMYRGLMGTTFVQNVTSNGGYRRGFDPPVKGGNKIRYWVSRDYIITYKEATS